MRTTLALVATTLALVAGVLTGPAPVAAAATNDAHVDLQWGLTQVRAPEAWARSTGRGQTIAVVDSGVDLTHPDLVGRIRGGATFFGCRARTSDPVPPEGCGSGSWRDNEEEGAGSGHGTHVAGIAAATAGNGVGIAGVAPDAALLAVKAIGGSGSGPVSEVAAGVRWAVHNGATVVNLSLGGVPGEQVLAPVGGPGPLREAIAEAVRAGVVVVAAAGNDFASICAEPAFDARVLCVVATDRLESRPAYSNLAVGEGMNVVAAPGGAAVLDCRDDVISTVPEADAGLCSESVGTPGHDFRAGTSMAAPHVAGVAALLLAQGRSAADVVATLRSTARHPLTGARGRFDPVYGFGIVDAAAAVEAPLPDPVERVSGADRVATAAAVSRRTFDRAHTVVLARADDYADALAGAPLAAHLGAPLLLSARDGLSPAAGSEVRRLGAERAVLLGSTAALSDQVRRDLESSGIQVVRVGGRNRFDTAAWIAAQLPASSEVIVTEGAHADPSRGWPDALSASGLAATGRTPILLVTRDILPPETRSALGADDQVTIVGGRAAVGDAVAQQIGREVASVRRLAGGNRYATSVAVAEEALRRGVNPSIVWVATGRAFADGLVAGAAAGSTRGLLLLVDGQDVDGGSPASRDFLAGRGGSFGSVRLVGGGGAISDAAEARVRQLVR